MRKTGTLLITAIIAVFFAACGGAADNKPANANANVANANTAKPVAAAPTEDALMDLDRKANEAYLKGDGKYFDAFLNDKFMMHEGGQRMGKAEVVKMIAGVKCEAKEGTKFEEPAMAMIDADTYVLTYKTTIDGSCTWEGKTEKIPSPVRSASVYVRNGDKWQAVFHGENLIVDPKAPPAKAEAKKEAPKKEEPKKEVATKEEPKKDDKATSAADTAAPVKPVPDANTDALVKAHTAGWEAFKAKDAKKFDEMLTANVVNVDPIGTVFSGKGNVIKQWTETMKCEGVTKVGVADGFASAISPTVELFTVKGHADGTCDGHKNGDLYQSTVYVKEGGVWKLAFMFEVPAM